MLEYQSSNQKLRDLGNKSCEYLGAELTGYFSLALASHLLLLPRSLRIDGWVLDVNCGPII